MPLRHQNEGKPRAPRQNNKTNPVRAGNDEGLDAVASVQQGHLDVSAIDTRVVHVFWEGVKEIIVWSAQISYTELQNREISISSNLPICEMPPK